MLIFLYTTNKSESTATEQRLASSQWQVLHSAKMYADSN